ncbi:hypothetical protein Leryth_004160 [Lithospermum erythrorhizon]|nr:hypothetical protein Leryth_004160 [Lithospermum erythrorhizon]
MGESSEAATSSASTSEVLAAPHLNTHFPSVVRGRLGGGDPPLTNDPWSGVIAVVTFWTFVSLILMLGIYGSEIFKLSSNASILIKPNPLFIQSLTVERLNVAIGEPMLYGFDVSPALDVVSSWSEHHKTTLLGGTHKEWMYYLNEGSQIDISYNVPSLMQFPLVLAIAEGTAGLARWLEDPSYPNITLLWKQIRGTGMTGKSISKSSSYYIAVGNLNSFTEEVELHFRIRALLYNTTNAYWKCSVARGPCHMKIPFTGGHSSLLTSFGLKLGVKNDNSTVKISYGPRWITYFGGIGGVMVLMSLAVYYFNNFRSIRQGDSSIQSNEGSTSAPLLSRKDDDNLSLGSSYDSVSEDDGDPEDHPSANDHENNNSTQRLCAICFDAPRDSFFLPCGHCVSCYTCGTKIAESAGTCPICRRRMKKVRKIYTI